MLEDFYEVTRRSSHDFNEQAVLWGRSLRTQARGECVYRAVDDPSVYEVSVERHAPGYLAFDLDTLRHRYPPAIDALVALVEANNASGLFVTPEEIERETAERLDRVLRPAIVVRADEPLAIGPGALVPAGVAPEPVNEPASGYGY